MQIGMTLPCMVRGLDRKAILSWCRGIDEGPFASLAVGERVTYHSTEMRTLLAAAAALTERVRIVPTLYILPMHPTALVAKEVASLDVLSNGRVTITVGVGGREHDYRAAEKPFKGRFRRLDEQVAELRRLWAGEPPFRGRGAGRAAARAAGRPADLVGRVRAEVAAPRGRVGRRRDGLLAPRATPRRSPPRSSSCARRGATRAPRATPRLVTGFWYALGPGAEERLHELCVRLSAPVRREARARDGRALPDLLGRALPRVRARRSPRSARTS